MTDSPTRIYLDYNATAPVLPEVTERMARALSELPGNPSSPHAEGQAARNALEEARRAIAEALGFSRREVIFTSGGSESNNHILKGLCVPGTHLITSAIEHPSLMRVAEELENAGVRVDTLPVGKNGVTDVEAVVDLIRPETRLISMMMANNETGVIQPVERLAALVREQDPLGQIIIHTDASQALGRIPFQPRAWGVDAVTLTAHKMGGPKGIGALLVRDGIEIRPLVSGGSQERGHRAGTESVFLAVGFHAALNWHQNHSEAQAGRLTTLRNRFIEGLRGEVGFFLNGADAPRLPNTLSFGFAGVEARNLIVSLDLAGVALSAGAACQSGALTPSHVLRAMGLPDEQVLASVRISMGHDTMEEEVDRALDLIRREVVRLRKKAS